MSSSLNLTAPVSPVSCLEAIETDEQLAEANRQYRVARGFHDLRWWVGYYLGGPDLVPSSNPLHDDLFEVWEAIRDPARWAAIEEAILAGTMPPPPVREARAAPRHHAKTTVLTGWMVLHAALYGYKRYVILKQSTQQLAQQNLDALWKTLADNPRIKADYGDLVDPLRSSLDRLILRNGTRIDCLGMEQGVRGRKHFRQRPDLIVGDDCQSNKDCESETIRGRHKRHWDEEVSKAVDPIWGDIVIVGTVIHRDALVVHCLKNPAYTAKGNARLGPGGPPIYQAVESWATNEELWDEWRDVFKNREDPQNVLTAYQFYLDHEEEMLEGARVLWPEYVPYYKLMVELVALGKLAFYRENMNLPMAPDEQPFDSTLFTVVDWEDVDIAQDYERIIGYWDPSVGVDDAAAQKRGVKDWSAWVVMGLHRNGYRDILDVAFTKAGTTEQCKLWWELHERWWCDTWGVEDVGFQRVILREHKALMALENIRRAEAGLAPMEPIPFRRMPQWRNKVARITRLQGPMHNGSIRLVREPTEQWARLFEQFDIFPSDHEMDGPDAAEGAYRLLEPKRRIFGDWSGAEEAATLLVGGAPDDTAPAEETIEADADDQSSLDEIDDRQRDDLAEMFRASIRNGGRAPRGYRGGSRGRAL